MNCKHRDCFTCPYEDCINDPEAVKLRKKAIKKDASENTEKRRQYMQDWYKAHRQERINKAMDRYWKKKEEINDKRRKSKSSARQPKELDMECSPAVQN